MKLNLQNFLIGLVVSVVLGLIICAIISASKPKKRNCAKPGEDINDKNKFVSVPTKCCNGKPAERSPDGKMRCPYGSGDIPGDGQDIGDKSGSLTLTFVDKFKNLDNWDIADYGMDRYTFTCANYTKDNVYLDENGLVLKAGPHIKESSKCKGKDGKYADSCVNSGRLASKFGQKYGIFLFCAKVPKGKFLFPALWLTAVSDKWPISGEIDLMETMHTIEDDSRFSTRIIVPKDNPMRKYRSTSLPPNGSKEVMTSVDHSYWNDYHVYAVDWKLHPNGDVTYDFYLDIKLQDGVIVNLYDGKKAKPYKSYSLRDMVSEYGGGKLASADTIRDAIEKQHLIMNIAVALKDDGKSKCDNLTCTGCIDTDKTMNVKYVQVWK